MSDKNWVILHLHSDISNGTTNIDSVTKYHRYIDKAKECGMKAIAFTEHGSIMSWVNKKLKVEEAGMKYIHASEFYLTEKIDTEKDDKGNDRLKLVRDNYHCTLIAKNYEGVKELNRLSSSSWNRQDGHFYYQPRITMDELEGTSDNIIICSACLGSALNRGTDTIKKRYLQFFIKNKHRCFLEIQHHNVEAQKKYNKQLAIIAEKFDLDMVACTDTHCLTDEDVEGRLILQKSKNVFFEGEDGWDLKFKTYDELVEAFRKQDALSEDVYMKAIENTNVIADMVEEFELDRSYKYPKLYDDSEKVIKEKIWNGIKEKGIDKYPNFDEYKKRIAHEMVAYRHNKALDFLLLEEDYKRALRNKDIYCGYSRGSCSGSIIAYILGITEIDSIKYDMNFERFMNVERVSLADIDSDWFQEDRPKVREYLYAREGLYCCDIITFNTIGMKGAIKDVARALDIPISEAQMLSDAVYTDDNKHEVVDEVLLKKYPELFRYVDIVKGTIVSVGNHPAGVVVSPYDVSDTLGLCSTKENLYMVSQLNMKEIDYLAHTKLDCLGLDGVGLINKTCELIGIDRLTPDNVDMEDEETWKEIAEDTTMVFQFEADYAGDYLKHLLSDESFNNIKKKNPNASRLDLMSMANGAIRPAGASYREALAQGIYKDNGNDALNEFLAPTLGYLVYQEQIMEFLHLFCGYTMGEADVVRRGFSKKLGTEQFIPKIKEGFAKTMLEKYNIPKEQSDIIITDFVQVILDSSSYLFSFNHSLPYSTIGYVIAYLRCHYKLETVTTALNIYQTDEKKSTEIVSYALRNNITINPIKFGKSSSSYTMDKATNSIYKGISSIKHCNAVIAEELLELYNTKTYINFIELLDDIKSKTSVNTKQLGILIGLDFFSDFGESQYLFDIVQLYDGIPKKLPSVRNCKQIKKDKIESYSEYGLTEYLIKKYTNKETEKQYSDVDNMGLLTELISRIPDKPMKLIDKVKHERDYLGYVTYSNDRFGETYYIVVAYKTYKDESKPYVTLRRIKDGEEIKARIKDKKVYNNNPFGDLSVLNVTELTEVPKKRPNSEGEWVETSDIELVLSEYEVIK